MFLCFLWINKCALDMGSLFDLLWAWLFFHFLCLLFTPYSFYSSILSPWEARCLMTLLWGYKWALLKLKCGGEKKPVLVGCKFALWSVFPLTGCSGWELLQGPVGDERPFPLTLPPSSSSGVSILMVLVPKHTALPPLITHLSWLMRELAGRPCCITALISI